MQKWPSFVKAALHAASADWYTSGPSGVAELNEAQVIRFQHADVASRVWCQAWLDVIDQLETEYAQFGSQALDDPVKSQASDFAPFCIFADTLANREVAETFLLEIAGTERYFAAVEALFSRLHIAQGYMDPIIFSFNLSRQLIHRNNTILNLDRMTLHQLHQALEIRYHYQFPDLQAQIAERMIEGWPEDGAKRVHDLQKQSGQKSRLLHRLGQSEP